MLAGAFPDPPGISWKFPAVSRKRTRTCFVGGEIQLWKIQLFAFKRGVVTPWLQFDRASDHRGIS
jgi:hypothetical protein